MTDPIIRCDPADRDRVVARYKPHTPQAVREVCARGHAAYGAWARTPGPRRGEVLYRAAGLLEERADEVGRAITLEEGKVLSDATAEVIRAVAILRFHAGQAERSGGQIADSGSSATVAWTRRRALGVVGIITPWNFPIAIPTWKLAPALAAGNSVVIKPSSLAPGAVLTLVEILHEAGVPGEVLQVVLGSSSVGEALADDRHVRAVSFTGSNAVGNALGARLSARGVRFQGELGGNSPLVVLADADVELAARLACDGAFLAAGQKCTATRRVIAEEPVYDAVLESMGRLADAMKVGPGNEDGVQVPPLVDAAAAQDVLAAVAQARDQGASVASGGGAPDGHLARGNFVRPTVLYDVGPGMEVLDAEVFGPVCAVLPAEDFDGAVECANSVRYGLSASICTNNLARAMEFIERSEAGMIHINRATPGADPHLPFGGVKASSASGYREQGQAAVQFFTEEQTVYLHWENTT